ncbi:MULTISPECIES: FAD-dependent oxidoreductase [unclassified Ruegeria]|uniref:GcvT family protein n=1 Tax=unclassified Ruegeria TaxID=2625375 RepID=UPI001490F41F|nr:MULTISPECIES: FAD-dependent oxidoreductase [unclassified Ruegeria]NOD88044.1 FAD-dependent oxidoreductase [Ruegeria sp. HKCCD4318]NOE14892.1 FAD-dependent oxidoreductase [Ruegeria sp. HKCCD4318-2]NOG11505.1 FAD-dependent oxidoreductase [Ruegeria sp. HKCCD4315]
MAKSLPTDVQVAIIGGGIVGCATAYHLAKAGWSVALFERKKLTSGTTWHAAGLVSETQGVPVMSALAKYGLDLMESLEDETGQNTGFKRNGSMTVALTEARMEELRRKVDYAHGCGLRAEEISLREAQDRWPLLSVDGAKGAFWFPGDGYTNPIDTTMALAKGARMNGAQVFEDTKVTRVVIEGGRAVGVETAEGLVRAEHVVNATGMWAREFGLTHGVQIPLHYTNHYYVVTDPIEGVTGDLPVLRVMDEYAYYKEDAGKLLIGCSEPNATPWLPKDGLPETFEFDELPYDEEHLYPILEAAMERVPTLAESGIRKFFNGPECFTPDAKHYLGLVPDVKGYWVAAGFNSTGIQNGPGAGKALAEWIMAGHMTMDLTDVDSRRIVPGLNARSYTATKAAETLGHAYAMHWPYLRKTEARGLRRTPYYTHLRDAGAQFGSANGWERPLYYGREMTDGFGREPWFDDWQAEHQALRTDLGCIDLTFGRFIVDGQDAESQMQRLCGANMAVAPGALIYTHMFNPQGGIEADVTVARLSTSRYLVMASAGAEPQTEYWLKTQLTGTSVSVVNVTSSEATLALMGPRARDFLAGLTDADLSNDAFPFGSWQSLHVGHAPVRAQRITYVGELGWELHIPAEFAQQVFETIMAAPDAPRLCGGMSVDSCRIEKGFRHWGHDIGPHDSPVDSGLTFACDFTTDFTGKEAIVARKSAGPENRLLSLRLDDPDALIFGKEPILCDGEIVGRLTSASYGWSVGGAIGMGYVSRPEGMTMKALAARSYQVKVAGRTVTAQASLRPLYDPDNARMRG